MIVDFENSPKNSIIYTSSVVIRFLKENKGKMEFDKLHRNCKKIHMEYSIFVLTIDWLYLVGLIREMNQENEVVLCD